MSESDDKKHSWEVVGVFHRGAEYHNAGDRQITGDIGRPPDDRAGWEPVDVTDDDEGRPTVWWRLKVVGHEPYRCGHGYEGFCPWCLRDVIQGNY